MSWLRIAIAAAAVLAGGLGYAAENLLAQGEYLVQAGGCVGCHTAERDGATPLAGGRAIASPFGIFYAPNITPDRETGIGAWSDADFLTAFWEGVAPDGSHYYPAFPYTSYTGLTRQDLLAIKAYLFSLEPVADAAPGHELAWYVSARLAARVWKLLYFEPARFVPLAERSGQWNRGAYLVRHLGHCGECHTPRNRFGALLKERELAGNRYGPDGDPVPNISAHRGDGIGRWSESDIEYFLDTGMLRDGDYVGGAMVEVVDNSTSKLSRADRLAIAVYLKTVAAQASAD